MVSDKESKMFTKIIISCPIVDIFVYVHVEMHKSRNPSMAPSPTPCFRPKRRATPMASCAAEYPASDVNLANKGPDIAVPSLPTTSAAPRKRSPNTHG